MFRLEREARIGKQGLWSEDKHADTTTNAADDKYGHYAFVAGVVTKAERIKNKVYLNFGDNWRTDFTATIVAQDLHFFKKTADRPFGVSGQNLARARVDKTRIRPHDHHHASVTDRSIGCVGRWPLMPEMPYARKDHG